jgi:plasmid stabilization system protein ParE
MSLPVILTPEAERDMEDAAAWYESHSADLGVDFIVHVRRTLTEIGENPHLFGEVHRGVRRASLRRFPYGVFYRAGEHQVDVVGIFHDHRDPSAWQSRT